MSTDTPVAAVASRLRMTEGQLYSCLLTLVAAILLATGLGGVHGVASSALATPVLQEPLAGLPTVVVPTAAPTPGLVPVPTGGLGPVAGPVVNVPVPEPVTPSEPVPVAEPTAAPRPTPKPSPTPSPCAEAGALATTAQLLATVNGPAGGRIPDKDVNAALGLVTGCDPANPAVVAIGLLIGIGHTLPDPGVDPPAVPPVVLPSAVVAALQPARPAIDAACGLVGTGSTVSSLFISAYPRPVSPLVVQVLFQSLSLCGQLRHL
jgi:hypothetical protein